MKANAPSLIRVRATIWSALLFRWTLIALLLAGGVPRAWASGDADAGARLYSVCTSCHGAWGQGNFAMAGPKLTGNQSGYLLKQLRHFQNGIRGGAAGDAKGRQMAAMSKSRRLNRDGALEDLVAYIQTLPDKPASPTITGNLQRGKDLFSSCASCHGTSGQGLEALGAPRLAGQNDWYLMAQLKHFAQGRRGYDPADTGGQQMRAAMSELMDIGDYEAVIAYINTLSP